MANRKAHTKTNLSAKRGLGLLIFLLFLYVLLPQLKKFHSSLALLKHVNLYWLGLALLASWLTYFAAGAVYCFLSKKRLNYQKTVLIQVASNFANKLLPAGAGAIGTSYNYLRNNGHNKTQAAVVVAANNMTGIIGHIIILVTVFSFSRNIINPFSNMHFHITSNELIIILLTAAAIIGGIIVVWLKKARRVLFSFIASIVGNLKSYRHHPTRLIAALLCAISMTLLYALTLHASIESVGVNVPFPQVILILTFGIAGGTLVPTPGGLGGAEAGLLGGLVAYHVSSGDALVIVLLYRLLTYWLALATGFIAFFVSGQMGYI